MARKILIIKADAEVDASMALANSQGTSEIVKGIPPKLRKVFSEDDLPAFFEEPDSLPAETWRELVDRRIAALEAKADALEARIEALEKP